MKILEKIKAGCAKIDNVLQCVVLYVGACAFDILSSLGFPPGIEEGNPFARHADGSFWLGHALITDGLNSLEVLILSASCYVGFRALGQRVAYWAAGLPWLYYGYMHLDAAFQNFFIEIPGLYQESASDVLRHLLGH